MIRSGFDKEGIDYEEKELGLFNTDRTVSGSILWIQGVRTCPYGLRASGDPGRS